MQKEKNIVLCGFMGCGKTTVGQMLAKSLSYEFVDTDELIEKTLCIGIPQIFAEKGEAFFRKKEQEILRKL